MLPATVIQPVPLRVVAGILRDAQGRVLIADRPVGKSMAGWWEFPGGKIADGEGVAAALARELREELGVEVRRARPMLELSHEYPDRRVELSVWEVQDFVHQPQAREGQ